MTRERQSPSDGKHADGSVWVTHWGRDVDTELLNHGGQLLLQVWGHVDLEHLQLDTEHMNEADGRLLQVLQSSGPLTISPSFFLVAPEYASMTPRWYSCRTKDRAHDCAASFLLEPCSRAVIPADQTWQKHTSCH